jgi:DNA uptake protein ComE-like DNA-binding protein
MKLPLITPKLARTIIRFRDVLGGYYSKSQLLEVYGLDTACYNSIVKYIKVDASKVEKLDINKATEKAMTHHPYIHKKLAKAIFDYRKQNSGFKDIKEIMNVEGVDKDLYLKLSPYLSITK